MKLLEKLITDITNVNWDEVEKIPEFQKLNEGGYHAEWHREGSSMDHTKLVVKTCQDYIEQHPDELSVFERWILIAASLFHDIGKGKVAKLKEDGNWSAPYHAAEGERLTRYLLWDEPFFIREKICGLVKYHMKPKYYRFKRDDENDRTFTEIFNNSDCRLLYYLNLFDSMGADSIDNELEVQHCQTFKQYVKDMGFWGERPLYSEPPARDFHIIMLCGVAGAGKTSKYKDRYEKMGYELVSRDIIRQELGMVDKDGKFKGNKDQEQKVTNIEHKRIIELCEQKKNFVSDNLFIRKKYRDEFIKMVSPYKPLIEIIYVETLKHAHLFRREGQIHPNTILNMMKEMDLPYPTETDVVIYTRNGDDGEPPTEEKENEHNS